MKSSEASLLSGVAGIPPPHHYCGGEGRHELLLFPKKHKNIFKNYFSNLLGLLTDPTKKC